MSRLKLKFIRCLDKPFDYVGTTCEAADKACPACTGRSGTLASTGSEADSLGMDIPTSNSSRQHYLSGAVLRLLGYSATYLALLSDPLDRC